MTNEDVATLLTTIGGLAAAYPREMSEQTIEVYAEDLRDCDPQALRQAVVTLRRTSKWLPSISEVRAAVVAAAAPFLTSAEAWQLVTELMRKRGSYRPIARETGDPVRRALVLCGKWEDCCQEDATWLRKRYVEIYDGLIQEARAGLASGDPPKWLELETVPPPPQLSSDRRVARLEASCE